MTISVWRIAEVTPEYLADDLTGEGANISGGRWNPKGSSVVYASENIALAMLETIVHTLPAKQPQNSYVVRINIPNEIWSSRTQLTSPPIGWDAQPFGKPSVIVGDTWLKAKATALLVVPSVVVPEECTVILNPEHPDAARITATMLRKWNYDCSCYSSEAVG